MTKIATFNVNSIKRRIDAVCAWLQEHQPDHLVLQELKCIDEAFPIQAIHDLGYHAHILGQKAYNGVAIISKQPAKLRRTALPNDDTDSQSRYLEIEQDNLIIAGLYLPNGNPVHDEEGAETEKFRYKLRWMERLVAHAEQLLLEEKPVIITGDFNVIPTENDVYDAAAWHNDALYHPKVHQLFHQLQHLGFWDGWRTLHPEKRSYSFWDYQRGRWQRGEGIRIDHFMLSPLAAQRLKECAIDTVPRGLPEPSDHTPVWCQLD